jgi:hypothetical protein
VILHHIAQCTSVLVVATAMLDPHLFGHRDLNVIDITPIPQRLQKGVRKAKSQQVLNCFFAQIMIDPVDLLLFINTGQRLIECAGRFEVMAEWLFHHNTRMRTILH